LLLYPYFSVPKYYLCIREARDDANEEVLD